MLLQNILLHNRNRFYKEFHNYIYATMLYKINIKQPVRLILIHIARDGLSFPSPHHTFWPSNLVFMGGWSLGHEKETHFCLRNFHLYAFYSDCFQFLPLYNTSILFQATGHTFSTRNMIFGLREPLTIRQFFNISFFADKGVIFPIFC